MQDTWNFRDVKINVSVKYVYYVFIFSQNINCGTTIETPRQGGFDMYQQSILCEKLLQLNVISSFTAERKNDAYCMGTFSLR